MLNQAQATREDIPRTMGPSTYLESFIESGDQLNNHYQPLFDRFATGVDRPTAALNELLLQHDRLLPLVLLGLVEVEGMPRIVAFHRWTSFPRQLTTTPYDGKTYVFRDDVVAGEQIEMHEWNPATLEERAPVRVRTQAATNVAINGLLEEDALLTPATVDTPEEDTQEVTARYLMPIPHCYLHHVMGYEYTPKQLWNELWRSMVLEDRLAEMKPLMDWLTVALHKEEGEQVSYLTLGPVNENFPPATGRAILALRHTILQQDLHRRDSNQGRGPISMDRAMEYMERLQARERAQVRAEQDERERMAKAPKLPSAIYPETTVLWKLVAGVEDDVDLPPVYQRLANIPKKESGRQVLQGILAARCRADDSATRQMVLLTKEVFEMIKTGQLGELAYCDDLTMGISPFTCGYGRGPKTRHIEARVDAFDTMERGESRPTIAEQFAFETKEVRLPTEALTFREMMRATSVIIDVIQGEDHPHAKHYRNFANL